MKKGTWLGLLLPFLSFADSYAKVSITEIMPNNVSTIVSEKYNYDGYVEFYNDGGNVDLKGWTVTNTKGEKIVWSAKLESSHIVPSGYSLLFFGKEEVSSSSASKVQSNYVGSVGNKLSTDAGAIIFEKDGEKIELSYPSQYPHLSYCADGFMLPTPGKENNALATSITNRVKKPSFKTGMPGYHESSLNVEFGCETDGAQIYYTLNGDTPTPENGTLYTAAINVDETTVLRARAYKDGMLYSEMLTGSFIFPDKFYNACSDAGDRLPIVSLTANNEDVYGDMIGFYVQGKNGIETGCTPASNYNQDWMRSANFEYILDGKVVNNQEVEIGVYGGCTRIHVAKSLKIKANKRSGKNKMDYTEFFPSRPYKKYKSLALRNGGNGYAYVQPRWRDMFIQSLADGMDLDLQVAQPVSFYLNGAFYGMMILTERSGADYVYHNYGLDEDEIDLFGVNGDGYICENGTRDAYDSMIDYVSKSYEDDDFYDKLNTHMDVGEYIDYQILEQYAGNTDWVNNNIKIWRKHDGGRFRWIVFDTDFGMSKATALDTCMLDFATMPIRGKKESLLVLMKSCMKNEDFRWRFLDQYLDRLEHTFTDERIETKHDSIRRLTDLDMCATIQNHTFLKCPGYQNEYDQEVENMRIFAKERKKHVISQLKKEFGLGDDTVVIKVRAVFPDDETPEFSFLLNKREFEGVKYNTWSYMNERVKVEPIIPYGYRIMKWAVDNVTVRTDDGKRYTENALTMVADSSELKFSIYFEHDPDCQLPTDLYLNEICASNASTLDENGEAADWIELYNGSDKDVDIARLTIENETKAVEYTFPSGYEETVVPAHVYKLLWADKNPELGPLHLNFKLGATASETIVLRANYQSKDVELSQLTFAPHNADESYGRVTDGASDVVLFGICIDDEGAETSTSTPLSANGSVECPFTFTEQTLADNGGRQVVAYGKKLYVLNAKGCAVRVYSIKGDMLANKKSDADTFVLPVASPGVYLVTVDKVCWKIVVE